MLTLASRKASQGKYRGSGRLLLVLSGAPLWDSPKLATETLSLRGNPVIQEATVRLQAGSLQ